MKYLILIQVLLASICAVAQEDIQIVKIKNEDRSVTVHAINNSDISYVIEVQIILDGMKLDYPIDSRIQLLPKVEKEIALLKPIADQTKYKINVKAMALENSNKLSIEVEVPDVTIYTKNGQEKSTEIRLYLQKHDISYQEINATYDKKSKEVYENMLRRRNIPKSEAKLPVVIIKGEIYHQIKDMKSFIKEHFRQ